MIQARCAVFETNSSSVHAVTYCTMQEFNDFLDGKLFFDIQLADLVPATREFNNSQYSYRDMMRIQNCDYSDESVTVEPVALSDGTKFGVIRYDREE